MKYLFSLLVFLTIGFLLSFSFSILAQDIVQAPGTLEEAKTLGQSILTGFPEVFKSVWQEAVVFWKKMLNYVSPWFRSIWNSILSLLGKEVEQRRPEVEEEFKKEVKELKEEIPKVGKSLWQRFKELIE